MARITAAKSRMSKSAPAKSPAKPPTKRASKAAAIIDSDFESEDDTPARNLLDKTFVLRLVLAKLDAVKSCDWHDLAQRMGEKKVEGSKPKKGSRKKEVGKVWTGTELHDIYHHTILPALKCGRALWTDKAIAGDLYLPSPPASISSNDKTKPESASGTAGALIEPQAVAGRSDDQVSYEDDTMEDDRTIQDGDDRAESDTASNAANAAVQAAEVGTEDEEEVDEEVMVEKVGSQAEEEEEQVAPQEKEAAVVEEEAEEELEDESGEEAEEVAVEKPAKGTKAKNPVRKMTTTYGKRSISPAKTSQPTMGYRQSVINKTGDAGKKRMRPAYSDDDEDEKVTAEPAIKVVKSAASSSARGPARRGVRRAA